MGRTADHRYYADQWTQWREDSAFAPPAGESLAELDHRVTEACNDLLVEASELNVAVFHPCLANQIDYRMGLRVEEQISWRIAGWASPNLTHCC